ncbi:energy-coupling factor transporter transmembrane component T family protein [Ferdinandcohnia quinoae]|uniref:Energy-coupling factor transporter transmembrane protein EcfT n=1 Tax=Fredinandcohnia quinoae TaxID=2918902 RepID=A0AAW5E7R1_9BACI|nr:energy-coupling factor transporter transmembrane protein EcfT [Fredinandcohnia sp. SECRCQ15]MCH1626052.1 energy-coupling factor transporter transmembrane protein EcfT [Fredinandcohnia sp. SECRCQ15]
MNIIIGRYVPGSSLLHKMDPRAKLLLIFFYVFIVFIANSVLTYILLGIYTFIVVLLTKIHIRYIISGLKPILWIVLFTFVLHIFMTKEGDLLFKFGWFEVFEGGIQQGIFISLRLFYLVLMTTILTLTSTPIEITDGMESLLAPFKKIGLPTHELALMMSIALRFIPTIMQETEKIIKAQSSRGVDFTSGPIKERMKAIVPLLIPLFISAFKRAEELAIAMEARGYRGGDGRTKLRKLQWGTIDSAMLASLLIAAIGLFLLRH